MSIALVVFDIAGTTVRDNDNVGEAFQAALAKFGYQIPLDQINLYMGYEKNKAIREILHTYEGGPEVIDEAHVGAIHRAFVGRMVRYYETREIEPLPHVEDTFAKLHEKGIKIALNTGFSRNIADIIIEKLGWFDRELIDFMVASDEVPRGRPYPDMIHKLMEKAGVTEPAHVAKIGDTEVDINEGRNVACRYIIGVTTGAYTRAQLEPYHPTHIIDDIADVIDIVSA